MAFSDRLREARLAIGLTQKEVADIIGVSSGAISNYETGTSFPNEKILYALFNALHAEPNFLYQDECRAAKEKAPDELPELTKEDIKFIIGYKRLSADDQASVRKIVSNAIIAADIERPDPPLSAQERALRGIRKSLGLPEDIQAVDEEQHA